MSLSIKIDWLGIVVTLQGQGLKSNFVTDFEKHYIIIFIINHKTDIKIKKN